MAELPFLVVHGWWISKLLVIACGVGGLAAMRALRRRADRKTIAMELAARTTALCGLVEGPVSVRGRLRGRAATTVALDGKPSHERSKTVTIEVEGRPVVVRGEIQVVRGSRARASWRRGQTFEVHDDDEVIAKGKLAHVASEGGDYRESAGEWVLEGDVEVFAARAVPPALDRLAIGIFSALYAGAGYCLLWGLGAGLVSAAKHHSSAPQMEVSPFGKLAIASALPHVRGDALDELENQLDDDSVHTETTDQLYVDVVGLRRGCAARAYAEIRTMRFEEALATARSCGARDAQGEALAYLGRYDEVAGQAVSPEVAIASGRWADAAAAADEMLARVKQGPPIDTATQAQLERRAQCLGLWFRTKLGDAAARSQLAELAPSNTTCAIAHALVMPVEQRADLLAAAVSVDREGELGQSILAQALAWSYGKPDSSTFATSTFDSINALTGRSSFDRFLWLGQVALPARPDDPVALARDATLAALEGDHDRAKREVNTAITKADAAESIDELQPLAQAIDLHTSAAIAAPSTDFPHPTMAALITLRAGTVPAELQVFTADCDKELRTAVTAATRGDGGPLAVTLTHCRLLFDANVGLVLAVAPRVTTHRAELAAALRAFRDDLALVDHAPFALIVEAATRRDLATLTGDDATAARWQRIVSAQAKLLGEREKLEALLLWEEL